MAWRQSETTDDRGVASRWADEFPTCAAEQPLIELIRRHNHQPLQAPLDLRDPGRNFLSPLPVGSEMQIGTKLSVQYAALSFPTRERAVRRSG